MSEESLKGKRATVMGLGLFGGGVGVTRFLVRQGAIVTVTDLKSPEALAPSLGQLADLPVRWRLGGHSEEDFRGADIVVVNPAVRPDSPYLAVARRGGARISTEISMFFERSPAPVVGVTGSNGKSTTTALIGAILEPSHRVWVGGNIGGSLLEKLAEIASTDVVVLELSSFQLPFFRATGRSPHVSVVTNLSPNHLDYHSSFDEYVLCKKPIIENQSASDYAVLNWDDPRTKEWAGECRGRVLSFSAEDSVPQGVFVRGARIFARFDGKERFLARPERFSLPGRHNLENLLAALAAAQAIGVDDSTIEPAISTFKGLEHRLEFVRELDGIKYYNDSIATTPESVLAAIRSFEVPMTIIAGGHDKGVSYDELAALAAKKVQCVVLIGKAAPKIREALEKARGGGTRPKLADAGSLREAVLKARDGTPRGGHVLLSPACASFDMFSNFAERGRAFKEVVWSLEARPEWSGRGRS